MSARRNELTRTAARLFAEKGYHGTSIGDLAEAMGVQKGSLYAHIESKADLLWEVTREGAAAFHAALDSVPTRARCWSGSGLRCVRTCASWPSSSTSPLCSYGSGATSRASGGTSSSPSGAAT